MNTRIATGLEFLWSGKCVKTTMTLTEGALAFPVEI
jgi:hypothetical protein